MSQTECDYFTDEIDREEQLINDISEMIGEETNSDILFLIAIRCINRLEFLRTVNILGRISKIVVEKLVDIINLRG